MTQTEHQRRIHVPQGHALKQTGTDSTEREGVATRCSYFDVVDPAGVPVGSYVIREARSVTPPFALSVTVEMVE